jgi:hypothetical protein
MGMVGILTSAAATPTTGATTYVGLQSGQGQSWVTQEARTQQVMPCAGTFDYLRVQVTDPGGAAQSRAFKLRKNTADTTLTATVSTGATTAQDTSNSVSVVAGDLVAMQCVSSASPAASTPSDWAVRFTAANNNEYPLLWGAQAGPAAGTTRYSPVQGDAAVQTAEANAQCVMPTPGVISNLYVALDANMATAGMVVTLQLNGADTALTCTVGSGASAANDTSNSVNVVAGDTISLKWANGGSNAPRPRAGVKFAPTTDGESVVFIPAFATVAQNLTRFQSVGAGAAWSSSEPLRQGILIACTLKSLYAKITGIASGQTAIATVRQDTADTTITTTITGVATTGNDTTHTAAALDDDLLDVKLVTSATSGTVTPAMGLVLFVTPAASGNRRRRVITGAAA